MQQPIASALTATTTSSHHKDLPAPVRPERCPVEDWLGFLGHRWNALLLWHLQGRPLRHQDLLAALPGITAKVLGERLKALQGRGLVEREPLATFPRTVAYGLTPQGRQVVGILDQFEQLDSWREGHPVGVLGHQFG